MRFNLAMFRVLALTLAMTLLSACQSLQVTAPGPMLESPLVVGEKMKLSGELGWRSAERVEVTGNAGARPPDLAHSSQKEGDEIYGGLALGLTSFLDVKGSLSFGTYSLQVKIQPLGGGYKNIKKGEVVGGGFLNLGHGTGSQKGDQATAFGDGGYPWSAKASMTSISMGASVGYLWSEELLTFVAGSYSNYLLNYEINQSQSRDGTSAAANYSGSRNGFAQAFGPGLEWLFRSSQGSLLVTFAREYRKMEQTPDMESWRAGGALKILF